METTEAPPPQTREFAANPDSLVDVRRMVEQAGKATPLTHEQMGDLLTAVDEAAANAICHGCPGGEKSFRVTCQTTPDGLIVTVHDHGVGFTNAPTRTMPGPEATGGRGLPLMCALSDSVEFASTAKGTTVTLRKFAEKS